MYQMTEKERTNLFNGICDLLDEYDYTYTDHAINKIIDEWATNKQSLLEAFKKHPNYIEDKYLIAFESDYERDIDLKVVSDFYWWMKDRIIDPFCLDALPDEIKQQRLPDEWLPQLMNDCIWYDVSYCNNRQLTENQANDINRVFPNIKAHSGEKTTRVVNRLCTYLNWHKHPDYNKRFAMYADALTPITIKRHTVLSVNPLDYLTMSFGNSWSSCHTIDKDNKREMPNGYEGQYSSGTISYMLDGVSMVLYTVDSKYDGHDFYSQPKITRQMFHYGNDKLIQSRLYPQSNDSNIEVYTPYRNLVQEIISTIFDFPNLWVKKTDSMCRYTYSRGTHYCDYTHFSSCNLTIKKGSENDTPLAIGHDPICIECGYTHETSENINCCRSYHKCERCGNSICGDVFWIDDEPYCEDCVRYCELCGEDHLRDECVWIEGWGWVCEDCLDEYFYKCEDCGEYVHRDDVVRLSVDGWERDLCESCADDYMECDKCGEYFHSDDLTNHNGNWYCDDCLEEVEEEEENEEEEQ